MDQLVDVFFDFHKVIVILINVRKIRLYLVVNRQHKFPGLIIFFEQIIFPGLTFEISIGGTLLTLDVSHSPQMSLIVATLAKVVLTLLAVHYLFII